MSDEYQLPYGDGWISARFPEEMVLNELSTGSFTADSSETDIIQRALAEPVNSRPLRHLVQPGDQVCIIVGDVTRLWVRHHVFMPYLLEELRAGGVSNSDMFVVSATGDHREQTPVEHAQIVGRPIYSRLEMFDHRARDSDEMVYLGHTPFDTPVYINRRVAAADRIILTGGIVHHFLAGFGGGGKAVLPGVSSHETIMKNHSLALAEKKGEGVNPKVAAGKLDGNPCYEDIVAGAEMARPTFLLNTVCDTTEHRIVDAVAGETVQAHRRGCQKVSDRFGVSIDQRCDLVVASCGGYPKDINLYQTYKTVYNARRAVNKGGTIVVLSECREGMGNDDFATMLLGFSDSESREASLRESFTIGGYMGLHLTLMAEECDIILVSDLAPGTLEKTGLKQCESVQEARDFIGEKHGEIPQLHLMLSAECFPTVAEPH